MMPTEASKLVGSSTPDDDPRSSFFAKHEWVLWMAVVYFLQFFNSLSGTSLGASANYVTPALNLTDSQFGSAVGMYYETVFAVGSLLFAFVFIGGLPARPHYLIACASILVNLAELVIGGAGGFAVVAIGRSLQGLGMVAMVPAAGGFFEEICPPSVLGGAWAIFFGATVLGISCVNFLAGNLAPAMGWRALFFTIGACGIAFALLLLAAKPPTLFKRADVGWSHFRPFQMPKDVPLSLKSCLCRAPQLAPSLPLLVGCALFQNVGSGAINGFQQQWLTTERGLSTAEASNAAGLYTLLGTVLGALIMSLTSDRVVERFQLSRPAFLALASLLLYPFIALFQFCRPPSAWFYLGFTFANMWGPVANAGLYASTQELVPTRVVGPAAGAVQCAVELSVNIGSTGGGYLVQGLRDGGSEEPYGWTIRTAYLLSAVSIVFALLAAPRFEQGRRALAELVEEGGDADAASQAESKS